jgi:hypothetical protein
MLQRRDAELAASGDDYDESRRKIAELLVKLDATGQAASTSDQY